MTRQKNVMKFFKDPKNWRNELAAIGLSVGTVMFLLSFLVLGVPTVWLLVACVPLSLPLLSGSLLKMRLPALLILAISVWIIYYWQIRLTTVALDKHARIESFHQGAGVQEQQRRH